MANQAERAAGSIYDLGYRSYEGARLGRWHAITSVYTHSLRGVFGLGRHHSSKIIPFGLAIITLLPAVVQVGFVALSQEATDVIEPSDYYEFIQWPLALFVAAVAPELVGRDQRNRTLSLYFSRALLRSDYVLAKVAALATALLILMLVPQTAVFLGDALGSDDSAGYLRDNWRDIAPIVGSGALLSLFLASIALAIGSQTSRWQLASGGVIAYFAITFAIASILVHTLESGPPRYAFLFSGFHVMRALTLWVFGITPTPAIEDEDGTLANDLALADVSLVLYALAAAVTVAVALLILYRRYRRMAL
jgi:ABC-2 type transport system permease protein